MREWVPTRRQLVSDVVAGLLVVAMLAIAIWLSRNIGSLNVSGDLILGLRLGEVVSLAVVFIAAMFGFRAWLASMDSADTNETSMARGKIQR